MKQILTIIFACMSLVAFADDVKIDKENCTITKNGKTYPLYGNVRIVDYGGSDVINVRIVNYGGSDVLDIKLVDYSTDSCNQVRLVDHGGSGVVNVRIVDYGGSDVLNVRIIEK